MATAAQRMQRSRRRRREGVMFVTAEVPLPLVLDLVEGGWLDRGDSDDPARVGEALMRATQHVVDGRLVGQNHACLEVVLEDRG